MPSEIINYLRKLTRVNADGGERLIVINQPYGFAISEFEFPGHIPWRKIGFSPASSVTQTTLWNVATEYVWPTNGMQMEVVSTDNINDKTGGTGALSVTVTYLNSLYEQKNEIVTLNGTTAVLTVSSDIFRINAFRVKSSGSSGKTAGTVSIRNATDHTTIYSQIAPSYRQARNSVYTVPIGNTLYIAEITFTAGYKTIGKQVRITLHACYDDITHLHLAHGREFNVFEEAVLMDGSYVPVINMPIAFPEMTDIKVSVVGEALALCTSTLSGWIE